MRLLVRVVNRLVVVDAWLLHRRSTGVRWRIVIRRLLAGLVVGSGEYLLLSHVDLLLVETLNVFSKMVRQLLVLQVMSLLVLLVVC